MKLTFAIPAYNEEFYLGDCLDTIIREKRALDASANKDSGEVRDVEIVVVNNASTDGTATVVKRYIAEYPDVDIKLVDEPNKGIVRARRAGLLAASGDLIANVDSDTRITPGWIKRVFDEFSRDPKLVALSGPFTYYDGTLKINLLTEFFYYLGFAFYLLNRFVLRVGSMLQGGNFIVRRDALEKIGGYDVSLSFYGEDSDIARRLHQVGNVKFTFKLPAFSSSRRLRKEGGFTTGLRYGLNYLWIMYFKKPFTNDYIDIRPQNKDGATAATPPVHTWKEWAIGVVFTIVMLAIVFGGIYLIYSLAKIGTVGVVGFFENHSSAQQENRLGQ